MYDITARKPKTCSVYMLCSSDVCNWITWTPKRDLLFNLALSSTGHECSGVSAFIKSKHSNQLQYKCDCYIDSELASHLHTYADIPRAAIFVPGPESLIRKIETLSKKNHSSCCIQHIWRIYVPQKYQRILQNSVNESQLSECRLRDRARLPEHAYIVICSHCYTAGILIGDYWYVSTFTTRRVELNIRGQ